ncbi:MAG: rhamnulokinase [Sphaerochaetaceae bacterium]|nr:rhamnulokinase [Sphaerochaetaceae bacterium]
MAKYITIDLGASNGRVIVGNLHSFEVMNRFVTRNEMFHQEMYWDIPYIFSEIKKGLKEAFNQFGNEIVSIGIDSWGVDYGLLDSYGSLISLPYHYRDMRTANMMDEVHKKVAPVRLFQRTGISQNQINTIYQLAAMKQDRSSIFNAGAHYLSIADLLNYWLTGVMANEMTNASTTGLFDPVARQWAWDVIETLGFPKSLFGKLVSAGTILGPLTDTLQHELGASSDVKVVAVGSHDTASAVAAVSSGIDEIMYISSGTWSLLGTKIPKPIVSTEAHMSGFTNELAVDNTIRFLKNIMGMWIQQECIRYWESMGEAISWKELDRQTLEQSDFKGSINGNDKRYLLPNSHSSLMVDRIKDQCRERNLPVPTNKGQYMVAIYRGLAEAYVESVTHLRTISGLSFGAIHIIGGGCKNEILDQWTADSTGLPVYAGPAEATAFGNMVVQSVAMGQSESLGAARQMLLANQKVKLFRPSVN